MPNEIIRKLKTLLNQGICSEAEVVYLLVGIRKLLELDGELKKTFPNLPESVLLFPQMLAGLRAVSR